MRALPCFHGGVLCGRTRLLTVAVRSAPNVSTMGHSAAPTGLLSGTEPTFED
ncbi:MAG: hypothetical protein NTX16_07755 [Actinobacteria bacterium]|nr:hypothetical protein [Actinomycetota bacterium]